MKIHSISYKKNSNKTNEWSINDLILHPQINLIVGKNATGKTKIITLINTLASLLLTPKPPNFSSGTWDIIFHKKNNNNEIQDIRYLLEITDHLITKETLLIANKQLLNREKNGKGFIHYEGIQQDLEFQVATQDLVAVLKRDAIQHPYLDSLYQWADSLLAYSFSTDMGRQNLYLELNSSPPTFNQNSIEFDKHLLRDPNNIVQLYQRGSKKKNFEKQIKADMKAIGYNIQAITVEPFGAISVGVHNIPIDHKKVKALFIKEYGVPEKIPQGMLSQGMFRALSLIIHLNYLEFTKNHHSTCILIDDIGEGLDFERSTKLIQLLIEKVESHKIEDVQLIMTTNDRFVMNKVPLKYWTIIERTNEGLLFYNQRNSPEIFEEFEWTGLNNFDLFSSDFYKGMR